MANERLYQFPSKASPVPADIIYLGDSANAFNECNSTIAQIISAYPGLSSIGGLITSANQMLYLTGSNAYATIAAAASSVLITSAGNVPSLSQTLPSAVQANITQLGAQAAALNMNSHLINSVTDPVSAQDAATKNYVDTQIANFTSVFVAKTATTGALTVTYNNGSSGVGATLTNAGAQAALVIDGVSMAVNDLVLVKNQASALQNGYYVVTNIGSVSTNWVLTRSTAYDQPSEINPGDIFVITAGTANANTSWIQTATVTTVGTDSISYSQFSVALPIPVTQGGTGLTTTTAYGLIVGGTTATGNFQNAGTGASGTILGGNGSSALPTWISSLTSFALTTPKITTSINDANGNSALGIAATASAVNYIQLTNAASGNNPSLAATGSGTNLALVLNGKGTGGTQAQGSTAGSSPSSGYVGEYQISQVAASSPVSVTRNVASDITTLSLPAGNWLVFGNVIAVGTNATSTGVEGWISTTSATKPDASQVASTQGAGVISAGNGTPTPIAHFTFSSTTTVYLSGILVDSASNGSLAGIIQAVRTH